MNETDKSSCCFEPISKELKGRLENAEKQINDLTQKNSTLSQELETRMKEIEKLRFEKNQILAEKSNAIDHLTIIKAKSDILKSNLKKKKEEIEDLNQTISNHEQKIQEMSDLLIKASERIKQNKIQLSDLTKQNEKILNKTISSDQEQIQQYEIKLKQYENIIREQEERIQNLAKKKTELKAVIKELSQTQNTNQINEKDSNFQSTEISKLKLTIQQMEIENKMLIHQNESYQSLFKKYNGIESDNTTLHENINRLENENKQLQKMLDESNVRIKELATPNIVSNSVFTEKEFLINQEKATQLDEVEKQNQKLNEEIKRLSTENKLLRLNNSKLSDKINELNYVALEQEKIKKDVLKFEVEMQEKEAKEQSLTKKYHYYKEKAKKQLEIINNFESKVNEINTELTILREREARKEAALRRKNRSENENGKNVVKLSRELFLEKSKNIRLNSKLHKAQLQSDINIDTKL